MVFIGRLRYETSSGGNTGLIIDIAPFANGSVPLPQAAAAAALGSYINGCYGAGKAVASGASASTGSNTTITIKPSTPSEIDRVQIREDQSGGQWVRQFRLTATLPNGTVAVLCPKKTSSIGNKFICALKAPLTVASVSLSLTASAEGVPQIPQFAMFRCNQLAAEIDATWAARMKSDDSVKSRGTESES